MVFSLPPRPTRTPIAGQYCTLEPLHPRHAPALFAANALDVAGQMWAYLPNGPYSDLPSFAQWLAEARALDDPLHFAVIVDGRALGTLALMRITPDMGVIEIGYVTFSPALQRSQAATEAFFLLMDWAFSAGYRRLEWKCNALNVPSRTAALRLGLSYEGLFRQAGVIKGRNRDTAWFAAIDADWPALRSQFIAWLAPQNFDPSGQQRQSLSSMTAAIVAASVPHELATRPAPGQVGALL